MDTFICAIVLYNKKMDESSTFNNLYCLRQKFNLQIKVVDNSTILDLVDYNTRYARSKDLSYVSMGGNKGLSKAYNFVLEEIFKVKTDLKDIIIWFDDDTLIQESYFTALINEIHNSEKDILVPIIVGQDGVMWSPNIAGFLKNKLIKDDYSLLNNKNFNAINSCTAVKLSVYKNYRYDERLFLDQVDHKFFSDQRDRNKSFGIINVEIKQCFSQREDNLDPTVLYNRLKIRFKDIIMYGSIKGSLYKLLAMTKCIGISLVLGLRTKSVMLIAKSVCLCLSYYFTINGE